MTCEEFIDTLLEFLSGELPEQQQGEGRLHLKVCPDCVNYLKSYEVTIKLAKAAQDAPAEGDQETLDDLVEIVLAARRKQDS